MPIDFSINQNNINTQNVASFANTQQSVGSLFGNVALQVDSPMSMLADAAEELTFAIDGTEDCNADERAEEKDEKDNLKEKLEKYRKMLEETGKISEVKELKDYVESRENKREALRQAQRFFKDISEEWLALQTILDDLENDTSSDPELKIAVKETLKELEQNNESAIRTGVVGILNSSGFADLGSASTMGALYRTSVLDFSDVNELYSYIQKEYDNNFDLAMNFLTNTLASDLASDNPSMEKAHLENVNNNLGQVRSLRSAHSICTNLLNRWENVHGIKNSELTDMNLLGSIMDLRKDTFISQDKITHLADKAKANNPESKVLFLQELLNSVRSFSPVLFDGTEGRMKILDAVQSAVDTAIEEEDAWLAQQ